MKALIPTDGQWHSLPGLVTSINCPLPGEVDLDANCRGRVRFPKGDGREIEVEYTAALVDG